MKHSQITSIIKVYYQIISPLLIYAPCKESEEIEHKVLSLLCEVLDCSDLIDECWNLIVGAKSLQTSSDAALLLSAATSQTNIAYELKMDILAAEKVNRVRTFYEVSFIEDLTVAARVGQRSACTLLAFLYWLGLSVSRKQDTALRIWSILAMNGNSLAILMLIYGYTSTGDTEKAEKWTHILDILKCESVLFSAIAMHSNYPEYSEDEVQTANLITFVSRTESSENSAVIDLAKIHYILNSEDDFETKIHRLSTDTNFFLVMYHEDKFAQKKYGF